MKLRSLLLMALASTAFIACNDKEDATPQSPKSVTINLANVVQGTKSAGGDVLTENSPITLSKYQIFFSDGTNLYTAKQANATADADQYIDASDGNLTGDRQFHFLPASVNKVILIGNRNEITNATTEADLDLALNIGDEQDADNLTLYAESGLTVKTPSHADGNPLYSATLAPKPRIARLFVKSFNCTFSNKPLYEKLNLEMLALNNYYKKWTLVGTDTPTEPNNTTLTAENVWNWFAGKTKAWDNDVFEGTAATEPYNTGAISLTSANTSKTGVNLYYHIFAGTTVPQLVLRASGDNTPLYLLTVRFVKEGTNEEITNWEAGMIYEMDFNFADTDFSQPDKCIDITVTPVNWKVTVVTPEYK